MFMKGIKVGFLFANIEYGNKKLASKKVVNKI